MSFFLACGGLSGRRALAVVRPDHEMVTALRLGGVWLPPFGGARSESEDVRFAPHSAWMEPMSRGIPAGICSVGSNQGLVWPQGQLRIIGYMRSLYPCARGDVAMIAPPPRPQFRLGTYNNGQPYVVPRGRYAPRGRVEDRLRPSHAVVDLDRQRLPPGEFIARILREMKIRFYGQKSVKNYRTVLSGFLRWFGNRPDLITREDVRCYLECYARNLR